MKDRIVSLLPAATEIVCGLGLEHRLVGRSHECDHPASVRSLPACTSSKLALDGTSYEIEERVRAILGEGLSVYRVDVERLRALEPDVILTQAHCEVCAVSLREVESAVGELLGSRPVVASLEPRMLADVWDDIRRVAGLLGEPGRGGELASRLEARVAALTAAAGRQGGRPSVACVEWLDPVMAAGNWVPELIERAGGRSVFGRSGEHSPWLPWEELRDADPDVIVIAPCGFDLERTTAELPALAAREGWTGLKAVRTGRVYLADGSRYFNRPGPGLVESLEMLAEMLHPTAFAFGHRPTAWRPAGPTGRSAARRAASP